VPLGSVPDISALQELTRIDQLLQTPGNAPTALRSLRGLITSDLFLRRAWELGVKAFADVRYDYEPPAATSRRIVEGYRMLASGDRRAALKIAREVLQSDANIKPAWELGFQAFGGATGTGR
jgi:hypothetical protein